MSKTKLPSLVKIFIIIVCFLVISYSVDLSEVPSTIQGITKPYLIASFLFLFADTFLMAIRCLILFKSKNILIKPLHLLRIFFVSNFLSLAVPSSVGADALRIIMLKKENYCLTHSTSIMAMDRIISVLSMALFSLIGVAIIWNTFPDTRTLYFVVFACLSSVLAFAMAVSRFPQDFLRWLLTRCVYLKNSFLNRYPRIISSIEKLLHSLTEIHRSFVDFLSKPLVLGHVFLWNALNQIFRIFQVHFLFLALGFPVSLYLEFAFVPIIMLLTLLPITYFGLGVREGAFIFFFSQVGVPPSVSLSVALLTYLLIVVGMLPGALLLWYRPPTEPS
ncbi:lysylphosphatidylglycerol synthase transmembrane domain-containing protein [Desulfonatronum parangueonense]